jgi:hypothetical protein
MTKLPKNRNCRISHNYIICCLYQVLVWDRHKNVAGINWLIGSQPSPLDTLITISYAYANVKNPAQICNHSQKPTWISNVVVQWSGKSRAMRNLHICNWNGALNWLSDAPSGALLKCFLIASRSLIPTDIFSNHGAPQKVFQNSFQIF